MKKALVFILALLLSTTVLSATRSKVVTELAWDNPTTNTGAAAPTALVITCGTFSTRVTAAAQLTAGSSGAAPLSFITANGSYTCTAAYEGPNGLSDPSNAVGPITRTSTGFTVAVTVPDAPSNFSVR